MLEGRAAANALKPPTAEALDRALYILLASIVEQNPDVQIPAADDFRFEELPGLWEALQVADTALSREARIRMVQVAQRRNTIRPVNRLPFELTADILLHSLTPSDHVHLRRLRELCQVQTPWWHVIKSHPHFWTSIHVGGADETNLKLRKSGGLPVKIICGKNATPPQIVPFFTLLKEHRARIERVDYRGRTIEPLKGFLESPMPRLNRLVIAPRVETLRSSIPLPSAAPLQHLLLARVALHWDRLELARLKSLVLTDYEEVTIPLQAFAEALRSCIQLEKLEFEYTEAQSYKDKDRPTQPIFLPALQSFSARSAGYPFIIPLLSILHADNLLQFKLDYEEDGNCGDVIEGLLDAPSPPPALASLLKNPILQAKSVEIEISFTSIRIGAVFADKAAGMEISMTDADEGGWIQESMGQLEHMSLSHCRVPIHVTVEGPHGDIDLGDYMLDLTPYTAMTVLHLSCSPQLATLIVQPLVGGVTQWSCPMLEEIHLGPGRQSEWGCDDFEWEAMVQKLVSLVGGRNNEEARSEGVADLTIFANGQRVATPDAVLQCLCNLDG